MICIIIYNNSTMTQSLFFDRRFAAGQLLLMPGTRLSPLACVAVLKAHHLTRFIYLGTAIHA